MDDAPEYLREQIRQKRVIVVAGAGVSRAIAGEAAPDWRTLIERGIEQCSALPRSSAGPGWPTRMREALTTGDDIEKLGVAEQIYARLTRNSKEGRLDAEWQNFLRINVGNLTLRNRRLIDAMCNLGAIATVNYDGLLHQAMGVNPLPWTRAEQWSLVIQRQRTGVLHLHGYWDQPETVVFGIRGYEKLIRDQLSQHLQHVIATTHSLLFVGCDGTFGDPNFHQLVNWMADTLLALPIRHFALVRDGERADAWGRFPETAQISVLGYGACYCDLLDYLEALAELEPAATAPVTRAEPTPSTEPSERPLVIGRDGEIAELVTQLTADDPLPIAILGLAGSGVTTIARAALHAPEIVARFGQRHRIVRCEDLTSAAELREKCAPIERLAEAEAAEGGPYRILILDNLQVTWHADRDKVEEVLSELADEPGLVLIASLRGQETPRISRRSRPLTWHAIAVPALDRASSRALFLRRAGVRFTNDPWLDRLLDEAAAGLPLAIVLLAYAAQDDPNLESTWQRWQQHGAGLLARPELDGRRASLAASLRLSITSPRTTDDARRLLGFLGVLPAGMRRADVETLLPVTGQAAMECLANSGLAYVDTSALRLSLPSPVREYVKIAHPPRDADLRRAIHHYAVFAKELGSVVTASPADPDYAGLEEEAANIEPMLAMGLEAEDPTAAIEGLAGYGRFLVLAAKPDPRQEKSELLRRAANLATARGRRGAAGACWIWGARLAQIAGEMELARESYRAARDAYRAASDPDGEEEALAGLLETEYPPDHD